jgi:hypothetical protein
MYTIDHYGIDEVERPEHAHCDGCCGSIDDITGCLAHSIRTCIQIKTEWARTYAHFHVMASRCTQIYDCDWSGQTELPIAPAIRLAQDDWTHHRRLVTLTEVRYRSITSLIKDFLCLIHLHIYKYTNTFN